MTRLNGEWFGYSYEWNEDQTDAVLVEAAGKHVDFTVSDGDASATRKQSWYYPSRSDCMVCHSRAANYVLGLSTMQTNRDILVDGENKPQLEYLQSLKLFHSFDENAKADKAQDTKVADEFSLPAPPSELPRLSNPDDNPLPL